MKVPKIAKRAIVIGAVAFAVAGLVAPGAFASVLASDVIPSPEAPRPVNVLPSTVKGVAPTTGTAYQSFMAQVMYSYARDPQFWQAASRVNAGTATAGEIELVQQRNGTYGVPATRTQTLTKVVGGVGTAISGYSIGATIGAGTLQLLGYDAQGAVCANTTGIVQDVVSLLAGQDCSGFYEIPPEFIPNEEVTGSDLASGLCLAGPVGTNVVLSPPTSGGTWTAPHPPLTSCSAGYLSWTPNSAEAPLTPVGYNQILSIERTGATFTAHIHNTLWGTPVGGTLRSSQIYFACLNSSRTGIAPASSVGGSGMGGAAGPNTVTYTVIGAGSCSNGGVAYITSRMGAAGATTGTWADQSMWIWTDGVELPPAVQESGDPLRTLRCVVVHSGGEVTRDSATFRETDGVLPQPLCPDTTGLVVESIRLLNVNTEDGTWTVLYEESTTTEYQAHQTLAPECSGGTCLLDLRKEGVGSCFQSPGSCAGWFADPNKESTYSCRYGTHAVDLAECTIYAPTFEPGATTTGNTYGDPTTGGAVTNPNPTAGTDPTGQGQACFPNGWAALNPIEWVFRPVQCVLQWAFVPRAEVVAATGTRVTTAWEETIVVQAPTIVNGWIAQLPDDLGGCEGPPVDLGPALEQFGVEGVEEQHPLSACDPPWDTIAMIANWVISGSVAFGGTLAVIRYISATIGFVGYGKGQGDAS